MQYCQGMNFLGMFLLEHITEGDEEQAFWILAQLIECVLSMEMYSNPSYFRSYLSMLEEYLRQLCPDIFNKLKTTKMQLLVFPFNEIFSLFTCSLAADVKNVNLFCQNQRIKARIFGYWRCYLMFLFFSAHTLLLTQISIVILMNVLING